MMSNGNLLIETPGASRSFRQPDRKRSLQFLPHRNVNLIVIYTQTFINCDGLQPLKED